MENQRIVINQLLSRNCVFEGNDYVTCVLENGDRITTKWKKFRTGKGSYLRLYENGEIKIQYQVESGRLTWKFKKVAINEVSNL